MASVFFSYSHKDESLRDQLETHLALLKNLGLIDAWYDRRIGAGNEVDQAIFSKLESADIILLLVSADFLASTYCYSREMARAMERHEAGEARVIPVILRHCVWHDAPFGKLLAAPRDGKPVMAWPDRDEALADVARQVGKAVEALAGGNNPALRTSTAGSGSDTRPKPTAATPAPVRSSNLRLRKVFSQQDFDEFLRKSYEFICRFFDASIAAIGDRNDDVKGMFEQIDSRRMAAVLYRGGRKIAECSVRRGGLGGRSDGIAFSYDASANTGSFNEMLSVEATDQMMYLKPLGMTWGSGERNARLSEEGAAEFLWGLFIKNAQ